MGINNSKTTINFLIVDRLISPSIMVGVSKEGDTLKYDNKYYRLIETSKTYNRIIYKFESDLTLYVYRTSLMRNNRYILQYILNNSKINLDTGIIPVEYKKIPMDSTNLNLIYDLQLKETFEYYP